MTYHHMMTYRYMMRRGLTLRMVPKKSSTNFWTVPFVDSNRVRKISGMDLQQHVIIIVILIIFIVIIIIIIIILPTYLCDLGMEASIELRRWSGLTRW